MKPMTTAEVAFVAYLQQIDALRPDSLRVYRQLQANTRTKTSLAVADGTPDVILGYPALGEALDLDTAKSWQREQVTAYLKAPFDPLPARWTIRGLQVLRSRLELWCQRVGNYEEPRAGLPTLVGMDAMAVAVGIAVPTVKLYLQGKDGRLAPPITRGRPSWCYEDALKDWATSLSISFPLEARYGEHRGSLALLEEDEAA